MYSRSGTVDIEEGHDYFDVAFGTALPDTNFTIQCTFWNTADDQNLAVFIVPRGYSKTSNGFRVYLSSPTPTANYKADWAIAEKYNP
jgi:hypothetical protein